jgi:hypothetical protein
VPAAADETCDLLCLDLPKAEAARADDLTREPLDHLGAVGFQIDIVERLKLGIAERVSAHKPAREA